MPLNAARNLRGAVQPPVGSAPSSTIVCYPSRQPYEACSPSSPFHLSSADSEGSALEAFSSAQVSSSRWGLEPSSRSGIILHPLPARLRRTQTRGGWLWCSDFLLASVGCAFAGICITANFPPCCHHANSATLFLRDHGRAGGLESSAGIWCSRIRTIGASTVTRGDGSSYVMRELPESLFGIQIARAIRGIATV